MRERGSPSDHGVDVVHEPPDVQRGYVELEAGQLHYRRTRPAAAGADTGNANREGLDRPPVVLLHQAPSSSWSYGRVLDALAGTRTAYALDLPGFGGSFVPAGVADVASVATVVANALDAFDVTGVHLVGHHTGASVALELATVDGRVRSLTLVGPPSLPYADRQERLDALDAGDVVPPLDQDGRYLREHWRYFNAEVDDLGLQHRLVVDVLRGRAVWTDYYRAVYEYDFDDAFQSVDVPRMVMAAPDDVLWDGYERLRDAYPDVEAVELSGGNLEPLLDAESLVDALTAFLDDVDADKPV
jgi:pimeloyl-ACP methyl ester carboxylesterase